MRVRIVIEVDVPEPFDPNELVLRFQNDWDFWPGNGYYVAPWEEARITAEPIEPSHTARTYPPFNRKWP
jgi:hypothetical protein